MDSNTLSIAARIRPCTKWAVGMKIYRPVQRVYTVQDTALDGEGVEVPVGPERTVVEDVVEVYVVTAVDPDGTVHAKGAGHDLCARVMPAAFGVPDLDDAKTLEALATEAKLDPAKATVADVVTALEAAALAAKEG